MQITANGWELSKYRILTYSKISYHYILEPVNRCVSAAIHWFFYIMRHRANFVDLMMQVRYLVLRFLQSQEN